jgi:hypothetical protein
MLSKTLTKYRLIRASEKDIPANPMVRVRTIVVQPGIEIPWKYQKSRNPICNKQAAAKNEESATLNISGRFVE